MHPKVGHCRIQLFSSRYKCFNFNFDKLRLFIEKVEIRMLPMNLV